VSRGAQDPECSRGDRVRLLRRGRIFPQGSLGLSGHQGAHAVLRGMPDHYHAVMPSLQGRVSDARRVKCAEGVPRQASLRGQAHRKVVCSRVLQQGVPRAPEG